MAVFGPHALGRPVIGSAEVISSLSRRSVGAFHRAMYTPGNIVVAAAGNVEHDRLVPLLEQAASKRGTGGAPKRRRRSPLVKMPAPGVRFQRKDTEQYHVCLAAPGIARSDRRRFAASLLDGILGGWELSGASRTQAPRLGVAPACRGHQVQCLDGASYVVSGGANPRHPECGGGHIVGIGTGAGSVEPFSDVPFAAMLAGQG